ncbi:hypothetical protein [Mangrovimonas sp. DI 80]|uniref:hypothetical protein n=1 Tax=Mangrovimonas sp. DI 80 TaxID=1779330 RepID=UPI0009759EC6|nr:hypothetical protein [Mangrovimonas sp. DI 80]OMP32235.1 hypothetical protein BKM32_04065 [Mangrovimonas sp. DI 80]
MKHNNFILLVVFCIGFVTTSLAQHKRYKIKNGIGIHGGITQFDILTDNFETSSSTGWIGGLSATVDLPHKWYTVSYNIHLSENKVNVIGGALPLVFQEEEIEYKMFTAQVSFLFHAKIVEDYITADFGPMIQYNSELELVDDSQENYFIKGYNNVLASDITDISKFNVNGAVGLSAGFPGFKLRGQYIYGFTNMLNKLNNNNDIDTFGGPSKFKGHQSMLVFTAMILF